jgi:uncharacterized SAM-binding protein YcdF (DUF218 family)
METFKTLVAISLSPLLIALMLQLVGWIFWLKRRRSRKGLWLIASGTGVLLLGSLSGFTFESQRAAQFLYPPLDVKSLPPGPLQIVVLGTGFNPDSELPANSRVGGTFLSRLIEGVRVLRARPDAELVVSIAGETAAANKQQFWQELQPILGLGDVRSRLITTAESTLDEAKLVDEINTGQPLVLATSAGHMPRAVRIFSDEGLEVLPAPTDYGFVRQGSAKDRVWERWVPSAGGLGSNHAWLYEAVAGVWQSIRG